MSEGTFCQPETLADTAKPRPAVTQPAAPAIPVAPPHPTLPDNAHKDPTRAGTLPTIQEQIDAALAGLQASLGHQADDIVGSNRAVVQAVGTDINKGVADTRNWLNGIQKYLNDRIAEVQPLAASVQYGQYAAVTDYQTFVQEPVAVLNALTAHGGNLQDLADSLDLLGQLGIDVATKYAGVSPEQVKQLTDFKSMYFDPVTNSVGGLYGRMQGGFDLGTASVDFLRALDEHLGDPLDFNKIQHRMLDAAQGISDALDNTSEMLRLATEYTNAAQSAIMAACMLLHAVKQFIAHAQDVYLNLPFMLATLIASLLPTGNLVFQVPQPVGTFLMRVDGMRGALAGLSDIGRCFDALQEDDATRAKNDAANNLEKQKLTEGSSTTAVQGLLDKIALSVTQSVAGGVAKLLGLDTNVAVPNPMDAVRAAWQVKTGLNNYKPPQPVYLPEEGALLGFLSGLGAIAGFVGGIVGLFGHGTSEVSPESLYHEVVDAEGNPVPVTPHPGRSATNLFKAVREAFADARRVDALARAMQLLADACAKLAKEKNEADAKAALDAIARAFVTMAAGQNLAVSSELTGLCPVATDHYACQGADAKDTSGNPVDGTTAETAYMEIAQPPAGAPNSVLTQMGNAQAAGNNPLVTGETPPTDDAMVATLPLGALPGGFYDSAYVPNLTPVPGAYTLLPLLMLMSSNAEYAQLLVLLNMAAELQALRADPVLLAAHRSLLFKAIHQGVAANSPYVWFGGGADSLPATGSVLAGIQHFLRHDPATDILPFAAWLVSATAQDDQVPFPSGLTTAENAAAQASLAFWQHYANQAAGVEATLLTLRLRADEHGGALGYEYIVAAAILTLVGHIRALLALPDSIPDQVTAVGAAALELSDYLTHRDFFAPVLTALAGEA